MAGVRYLLVLIFCLVPVVGWGAEVSLEIRGVNDELREVLQTALALPASQRQAETLNPNWVRVYQRRLPGRASKALEPYGYFQAQATSRLETEDEGDYRLVLEVDPGEPVRVATLELELTGPGQDTPELRQRLADFPLQIGDVLRQDLYEQGKAELSQQALALGYLDADFRIHRLQVELASRQAMIQLHLETGPRYQFGETSFNGAPDYPRSFLLRFLGYREGAPFSHRQLGVTRLNLVNADLFDEVSVRPLTGQRSDRQVPVRIELDPAPRHRLRTGIGYGTDTGARLSLKYHNINLLKRGHELEGKVAIAERQQSLSSTYIIPDSKRLDSRTLLRFGLDREETESYLSREIFSEAEYQRSFTRGASGSLFLRASREKSIVGEDTTRSKMLIPGVRGNWRRLDDQLNPQQGTRLQFELLGASDMLLSDTSLLQLSGKITRLQPLPWRTKLLLNLQAGTTWHPDPLRDIPASLRFFAGGDRSVRGYKYQSLGPRDAEGNVIGGKHLLVASLELEKKITDKWGAAVFFDAGNAFDNLNNYDLERGAGIGLRRYTRIGAIRLDLARQLGRDKNHFRLHLNVGIGW